MMYQLSLSLFLLLPLVSAANDWRTPCEGSCAYESGDGTKKAWSTILIDGPSQVVSDISTAAGWSIMDCDANSRDSQTIRLACHDPDGVCDSLFNGGAENTIVRLPEDCADAPFARVVSVASSRNQTLTSKVAKRVAAAKRRRSTPPEVLTVVIDYQFNLIPVSRGTVSLTALATTNPLQRPMATVQKLRRALGYDEADELRSTHHRRSGGHRHLVSREIRRRDLFTEFINGNSIPAGITAKAMAAKTTSKEGKMGKSSNATMGKSSNATMGKLGSWDKDWNKQFDLLDINKGFNVANVKLSCPQNGDIPAFDAKVLIDAEVEVKATVTVGFITAGSIIPPKIDKAAFTAALDGGAQASFKISADAKGSFNTGLLPLYSSGLAGLSIPGILDVGPSFSINGQGIGSIGVRTDAVVKASYKFPGISMVFPRDQGTSTGAASQGDTQTPLSLSIGGSAQLTGAVEAHIVPRVDVGVKVFSGAASASVYLQLDGYGALNMDLKLEGSASTGVGPTQKSVDPAPTLDSGSTVLDSTSTASSIESTPTTTTDSASSSDSTSTTSSTESTTTADSASASDSTTSSSSDSTTSTSSDSTTDASSTSEAKENQTTSSTQTQTTSSPQAQTTPAVQVQASSTGRAQPAYTAPTQIDISNLPSSGPNHYPVNNIAQISSSSQATPSSCPSRRMRRRMRKAVNRRDAVVHHPRDASGSFSGCVGVGLGVKIVAGAQGQLFNIWKANASFDLFNQKWDIFSKCFNHNFRRSDTTPVTPTLFGLSPSLLESRQLDGSSLICPAITDAINTITQIV